jgi:putative ABC transport system permease protein
MLKNYLKFTFRNLIRSKVFSIINIVGLAVGLASSFIILLFVIYELSYDGYNKKLDDIYIIKSDLTEFNRAGVNTPYMLGPILKEQFPEIKKYARRRLFWTTVKYNGKSLSRVRCTYADPDIFNILTLPVERGNINELFKDKNTVVITKEIAKRYFGNKNPIGKVLKIINSGGSYEVKVASVIKNIPETSTFRSDLILPISLIEKGLIKRWRNHKDPLKSKNLLLVNTYLLLNHGSNIKLFEKKLSRFSNDYSENSWKKLQFHLLPVKDIYFHAPRLSANGFPAGNLSNVYVYAAIGLLILLIACINIIILNTGRAVTRAREIGVRKVIGARRSDLVRQILIESTFISLLSFPIAVGLVEIFLPSLSILLGKKLPVDYFHNFQFALLIICIAVIVGILSGGYISFYLSKLQPADIIRNKINIGSGKTFFRKVLISVQMIIFIGLIIAFITINKQMAYFHNKYLGFNKNNLLVFEGDNDNRELTNHFDAFKNELEANPEITAASGAFGAPATEGRGVFLMPSKTNPSKKISVEGLSVDKDFFETMGMKIIKGRGFAGLTAGELKGVCVINQAAVKQLGFKNPLNELIGNQRIIGIVKDFNMHSLREPIAPMAIHVSTKYLDEVVVRVRPDNISQTLKFAENISKKFNYGKPMNYEFFDERIDMLYGNEHKFDEMIGYFTGLAIFIACLGLFGLSLFISRQRIKEIGIRKVMGASTGNIFLILTKEFIILTIISAIIAAPISIYFINKWLQNFSYKITPGVSIFILSIGLALTISLISIGFQSVKSALSNPVEFLRNE